MRKAGLFTAILFLTAVWAVAQTSPSTSPVGSQSSQTTIQGCLSGSNGSFTVTDTSGVAYMLQGDTSKLADHIGQEVRITGTQASSGSSSGAPASGGGAGAGAGASASGSQQALNVSSVDKVSETCSKK